MDSLILPLAGIVLFLLMASLVFGLRRSAPSGWK